MTVSDGPEWTTQTHINPDADDATGDEVALNSESFVEAHDTAPLNVDETPTEPVVSTPSNGDESTDEMSTSDSDDLDPEGVSGHESAEMAADVVAEPETDN